MVRAGTWDGDRLDHLPRFGVVTRVIPSADGARRSSDLDNALPGAYRMGCVFEILAIVASPLIAFLVGKVVSDRKERRERRHRLFESLWLTQHLGAYGRLSPEHVRALNMVEIEFAQTSGEEFWENDSETRVLIAWAAYRDHLYTPRPFIANLSAPDPTEQAAADKWDQANNELLGDLLHEMASALGYSHFDRQRTRMGSYAPIGYANSDFENAEFRTALLQLARGQRALHVTTSPAAMLIGSTVEELAPPSGDSTQPALPKRDQSTLNPGIETTK